MAKYIHDKYPITPREYSWRRWLGVQMVTEEYRFNHDGALPDPEQVLWLVEDDLDAVFSIMAEEENPCK